jgi:hypothetical protein
MKKILLFALISILYTVNLLSQSYLDTYISSASLNTFVEIAGPANQISSPVDLDFHPNQNTRPNELWILNQGTYNSGGSSVIITNANSNSPTTQYVQDGNAWHFMAMASGMAFSENEKWANSADILDANRSGGRFTGPSLWSSDLNIYGVWGNPPTSQNNGSHLDMVHQSPYGKGIAAERDNVYWIYDGWDETVKRYDFVDDHGPGQHFHGDAIVRVYADIVAKRHATLPSHLILDEQKKYLYGCDPVSKLVFRLDITTGSFNRNLPEVNTENLVEYSEYTGATTANVVTSGLNQPVGIDVKGDRLIVTDNATKEIIFYDISNSFAEVGRIALSDYYSNPGILGITVGPDGKIYFVDDINKKVFRIDNSNLDYVGVNEKASSKLHLSVFPNPVTQDIININSSKVVQSQLINISGKIIDTKILNEGTNQMDISALSQGMYFLRIIDDKEVRVEKIQVVRN